MPESAFMVVWPARFASLPGLLARGGRVVHCEAGPGRAGSVVARLLVEDGMDANVVIEAVRPGCQD